MNKFTLFCFPAFINLYQLHANYPNQSAPKYYDSNFCKCHKNSLTAMISQQNFEKDSAKETGALDSNQKFELKCEKFLRGSLRQEPFLDKHGIRIYSNLKIAIINENIFAKGIDVSKYITRGDNEIFFDGVNLMVNGQLIPGHIKTNYK